jgi:hypothetical protein
MANSSIVGFLDLNGYMIGEKLYVRELALLRPQIWEKPIIYHFEHRYPELTPTDVKSGEYCYFNVHGLSLYPSKDEMVEHRMPEKVVREFYDNRRFPDSKIIIKGGHHKVNFLKELDIPFINAETFNCPRLDLLPAGNCSDCGCHQYVAEKCAAVKTYKLRHWWRSN